MALWFSGSAVVPQLTAELGLSDSGRSWLTMSVQLGFVVGALASALTNLPDRLPLHWIFAISYVLGAGLNALTMAAGSTGPVADDLLRSPTGVPFGGLAPLSSPQTSWNPDGIYFTFNAPDFPSIFIIFTAVAAFRVLFFNLSIAVFNITFISLFFF